jgi:hypothetical protein
MAESTPSPCGSWLDTGIVTTCDICAHRRECHRSLPSPANLWLCGDCCSELWKEFGCDSPLGCSRWPFWRYKVSDYPPYYFCDEHLQLTIRLLEEDGATAGAQRLGEVPRFPGIQQVSYSEWQTWKKWREVPLAERDRTVIPRGEVEAPAARARRGRGRPTRTESRPDFPEVFRERFKEHCDRFGRKPTRGEMANVLADFRIQNESTLDNWLQAFKIQFSTLVCPETE